MKATSLLRVDTKSKEQRRHQRVKVAILGRYMLANRQEFPCQTLNMSPGGVALVAPVVGNLNERIICYLDQLGRVEGTIARHFNQGFALQINVPLIKREKLADQLTWLANRQALGMPEDRRHERIVPRVQRSTLILPDGRGVPVKLIDISLSGAAMVTDMRPPIGTLVTLGQTSAHVVRVFANGIAVEFSRPVPLGQFSEDLVF